MSTSRKMLMAPLSMDKTKSLNVDAEENAQCGWEKDGMDLRRRKKKRKKRVNQRANQRANQRVRKTLKEKRTKMKRKKVKRRRRKAKTIQTKRKNLKMMESNKEKNQARKITHPAEVSLAEEVVERVVAHLAAHPAVRPAVVSLAAKGEERAVAHPVVVRANKTTNPKKTNSLTPPRKKRKKAELKNLKMMVEMVTSWLTQSMNQDLRLRITILKKRTKNQKRTEKTKMVNAKMVIEITEPEMVLEMEPEMMAIERTVIERTAIERTATEKRVEMVNAQPPPELLTSLWMDLLKRKKKESPLRDSLKTTTQLKNTALQRISLHWSLSSKVSRTLNKITSLTLPPTTHPLDLSFLKTKEGLAI